MEGKKRHQKKQLGVFKANSKNPSGLGAPNKQSSTGHKKKGSMGYKKKGKSY